MNKHKILLFFYHLLTITVAAIIGLIIATAIQGCNSKTPSISTPQVGSLEIIVCDRHSKPLSEAKIEVVSQNLSAKTDTTGFAKIKNIPKGQQIFLVSKENYFDYQFTAEIKPSQTLTANVALAKRGVGDLKIIVYDEKEKPLSQVSVKVKENEKTTDENGEALFLDLLVEEYEVIVSKVNYTEIKSKISISEGKVTILSLILKSQVSLPKGVILGHIYDYDEKTPIPNAVVSLDNLTQKTNENGEYKFENLKQGTYSIKCSALGYADQAKEVVLVQDEVKLVDFVLVCNDLATLDVFVYDEKTKEGIANASVKLNKGFISSTTDTTGYCHFENLSRNESLTVRVSAFMFASAEKLVKIVPRKTNKAEFFLMSTSGSLKGRVVRDSTNRIPIANAWVTMDNFKSECNENGEFIFEKLPSDGYYCYTAYGRNNINEQYYAITEPICLESGKTTDCGDIVISAKSDDEPNNSPSEAKTLLFPNFCYSFIWDSQDIDYFTFALAKSTCLTIIFSVTSSRDIQYYCDVLDAQQAKLASIYAGSSGDQQTNTYTATLPEGKYYLKVHSAFGKWNRFDKYKVEIK